MVLALGPLEQVELDEARHTAEMAVAAEPDRLEIGLAALGHREPVHCDVHGVIPLRGPR